MDNPVIRVKTPLGDIVVQDKGSEDFPGVWIVLSKNGEPVNTSPILACVEYDSVVGSLHTNVYDTREDDPDDDPAGVFDHSSGEFIY